MCILQVLVADAAEAQGQGGGAAASFRTGADALAAPYNPKAAMFQVGSCVCMSVAGRCPCAKAPPAVKISFVQFKAPSTLP